MNATARRFLRLSPLILPAIAVLGWAGPAEAHPFGPPPTAEASLDAGAVTIVWRAQRDDVLSLAARVGALAERVEMVFAPDGTLLRTRGRSQEETLATSNGLRRYLQSNVRGFQDGEACRTTVEDQTDLTVGARLRVDCPRPIDDLDLQITLLHDLHPNYRTLLTAPGATPERAAFTPGAPRHRLSFVGGPAEATAVGDPASITGLPVDGRLLGVLDGPVGLAALGIALLAGLLHGLGPGHAKAAGALYLGGSSARRRHALLLGATVAAMHLVSTSAFAAALYFFTRVGSSLESVTRWLQLLAALLVLAVGVGMLARARRSRRHRHHGHSHDLSAASPYSPRGLAALALAGGILPSPTAFLTLSTALFAGRFAFGLALVVAFSVGLAATVAIAGLLGIEGSGLARRIGGASRRAAAPASALPIVAAVAVVLLGGVMTAMSATQL